jgi:hypothetical protein
MSRVAQRRVGTLLAILRLRMMPPLEIVPWDASHAAVAYTILLVRIDSFTLSRLEF